jgi:hypothetical protein
MIPDRQNNARAEASAFFESRDSLQTSPERSVCISSREPVVTEMREPPSFKESVSFPAVVYVVEEDKTTTQILKKGPKKTCKKTRTTGSGKKQFAIPNAIFRWKRSTAKKTTAETEPKGSCSSKTTAKNGTKKDPSPPKALSPSTLPKLEGTSSLKTTVKKEMKKKLQPPIALMPSTVLKRGSLFLRTYARGKPKKIVDSQIGDCITGQVKNQRTVNDNYHMR